MHQHITYFSGNLLGIAMSQYVYLFSEELPPAGFKPVSEQDYYL